MLGVDVGYSASRKTTGLAWYFDGDVELALAGSSWADRRSVLPRDAQFSKIALDAPIVPSDALAPRACEALFNGRPFWNRCRPGLSHHGRGLPLRIAGKHAFEQFAALLDHMPGSQGELFDAPAIEAFPNAFLGVLTPEAEFLERPAGPRKSDWLYETAARLGAFAPILDRLEWKDVRIDRVFATERDHDRRAALICLMTAALAYCRNVTVVGDETGGWFWLPPIDLWQEWARRGLDEACGRLRLARFPGVSVVVYDSFGGKITVTSASGRQVITPASIPFWRSASLQNGSGRTPGDAA